MTVTDRTDASEQEFRDRIAAFEGAPTPPEVVEATVIEEVARAIFDASNPIVSDFPDYWHRVAVGEETRDRYRRLAAAAVAAYRATQDGGAEEAVRTIDQLTRKHFGEWVDVPDRQAGGYLYVVRDEFHDGYPGRYVVLVHDDGTAEELEFTDSGPAGYPKTMRTPCSIRVAIAPQAVDGAR